MARKSKSESVEATVAARITSEERLVLDYLSEKTNKKSSILIREALRKTYDFDGLLPAARSFFEVRKQALAHLEQPPK